MGSQLRITEVKKDFTDVLFDSVIFNAEVNLFVLLQAIIWFQVTIPILWQLFVCTVILYHVIPNTNNCHTDLFDTQMGPQ